jgi:hypothetical protein
LFNSRIEKFTIDFAKPTGRIAKKKACIQHVESRKTGMAMPSVKSEQDVKLAMPDRRTLPSPSAASK